MQISWTRLPFRYVDGEDYEAKLTEYIGDTFYDTLPAEGYEERDEQIYTAFQMARAFAKGETFFAEAGTGTGKTFAYLLPAICEARRKGSPVVVAVAGGVLESQLAGGEGDIATLSRILNLDVDARVARGWENYLCEVKVDALRLGRGDQADTERLRTWAETTLRGERTEIGDVSDELWETVAWDPSLPCDTCKLRGHCHVARARDDYHKAQDLVICSHELFFLDLWTRRERQEAGLRPFLPAYSGVVFDEGHRVPGAAQLSAGNRVSRRALTRSLQEAGELSSERRALAASVQASRKAAVTFWRAVAAATGPTETERYFLARDQVREAAGILRASTLELQDQIAMEEDQYRGTEEEISLVLTQARLDHISLALRLLVAKDEDTVAWVARPRPDGDTVVHAVPRRTERLMHRELFDRKLPVLFTSATLAHGGSFNYLRRVLGLPGAGQSRVDAPFDYASQALIYMPAQAPADPVAHLLEVLHVTGGRALVLVESETELAALRQALAGRRLPWPVLWEGDAERAELLRRFREEGPAVLVGTAYWEGVDVPGEALSCVAVLRLPFPVTEPLVASRREDADTAGMDPFLAVDVPEMALKLKQGFGRLIRTTKDRGVFALLDLSFVESNYEEAVRSAFPADTETTDSLDAVREFLGS